MARQYISTLKTNKTGLDFRLKKLIKQEIIFYKK